MGIKELLLLVSFFALLKISSGVSDISKYIEDRNNKIEAVKNER